MLVQSCTKMDKMENWGQEETNLGYMTFEVFTVVKMSVWTHGVTTELHSIWCSYYNGLILNQNKVFLTHPNEDSLSPLPPILKLINVY